MYDYIILLSIYDHVIFLLCNVPTNILNLTILSYNTLNIIENSNNSVLQSFYLFLVIIYDIQHGAVRMSQKNENNPAEMASRNSSSEESGEEKGRTSTHQKITLPIFEKKTSQEAKLLWRRFIQYVKMTQKNGSKQDDNGQRNH